MALPCVIQVIPEHANRNYPQFTTIFAYQQSTNSRYADWGSFWRAAAKRNIDTAFGLRNRQLPFESGVADLLASATAL